MTSGRAAKILQRTRVGGTLTLALTFLLWASSTPVGGPLVIVLAVLAAGACVVEAGRMGLLGPRDRRDVVLPGWLAVVAATLTLVGGRREGAAEFLRALPDLGLPGELFAAAFAALVVGWLAALPRRAGAEAARDRRVPAGTFAGTLVWLGVPLPALWLVHHEYGAAGLTCLLVLSKGGDIAGYYAGNALGRRFPHHPFPKVSPNKTAVGCWASLAAAVALGGLLQAAGALPEARLGALSGLLAGTIVNVAAQAGDLLESRAKRWAGVKDSSTVFGPSGGFLDLVDSLLLSVPAALLTWPWLFRS